jgi:hypothetical protein
VGSPYGAVKRSVIASHGPSVTARWRASRLFCPPRHRPAVNELGVRLDLGTGHHRGHGDSKPLSKNERVANFLSEHRVNDNAAANGTARITISGRWLQRSHCRQVRPQPPYPGRLGDSMRFHDEIRVISCFFAEAVVRNDERSARRQ